MTAEPAPPGGRRLGGWGVTGLDRAGCSCGERGGFVSGPETHQSMESNRPLHSPRLSRPLPGRVACGFETGGSLRPHCGLRSPPANRFHDSGMAADTPGNSGRHLNDAGCALLSNDIAGSSSSGSIVRCAPMAAHSAWS